MTAQGSPAIMLEAPGEDRRAESTLSEPERARNDMSGKLPRHGRFGRVSVGYRPRLDDLPAILAGRDGCLGSIAWEASTCLRSRAGNVRKNRMSLFYLLVGHVAIMPRL